MGTKDLTEKILEDYNDVFADIINVLLFNGEQRVTPDSLVNGQPVSQYKADDSKLHEQERDVVKIWNDGIALALFGIENQTKVDKLMPLRIAGYEGASYRSQYQSNDNHVFPVVTLVLYFGEDRWKQPKTLKGLMNIPDGLDAFVNDRNINVFEVSYLSDEQINMFKSDFKIVANFFVKKRKYKDYIPDDETEIQHVDEILKLLQAVTGDNSYEEILVLSKGKVKNMCEVAERLKTIGRNEGYDKGVAAGLNNMIEKMLKLGRTPEEIAEFSGIDIEEVNKVASNMLTTV